MDWRRPSGQQAALAAALFAVAVAGCGNADADSRPAGEPTPPEVVATAQMLTAQRPREQRAALTPALASALPRGRLLPEGAELTVDPEAWLVSERFGNVTGTLTMPGEEPRAVEIGFKRTRDGWRVTYLEELP